MRRLSVPLGESIQTPNRHRIPYIVPEDFEAWWAGGEPVLFITGWGGVARQLIFHGPEQTRVIGIFSSVWVLANHHGQ